MGQRGRRWGPLLGTVTCVAAIGCATSGELANQRMIIGDQIHEIDSLRALTRTLYDSVGELRDSLQFIDDIETGQYYRDMRTLEDRIRRLEFLLHQQEDGITVAEIPADALYEPASALLTDSGRALLDSVAATIMQSFADHAIRVEGHADPSPLGPSLIEKYGNNWGLSTARAASVVSYLLDHRNLDPVRMSAIGYGSTRPVASNETASGRRQNRRIRVSAIPPGEMDSRSDSALVDF